MVSMENTNLVLRARTHLLLSRELLAYAKYTCSDMTALFRLLSHAKWSRAVNSCHQ